MMHQGTRRSNLYSSESQTASKLLNVSEKNNKIKCRKNRGGIQKDVEQLWMSPHRWAASPPLSPGDLEGGQTTQTQSRRTTFMQMEVTENKQREWDASLQTRERGEKVRGWVSPRSLTIHPDPSARRRHRQQGERGKFLDSWWPCGEEKGGEKLETEWSMRKK